jgi:hypothetical protein
LDEDEDPLHLDLTFTCKTHPDTHPVHFRGRMKTGEGTANLQKGVDRCLGKHGETEEVMGQDPSVPAVKYSEATHRALIALRCAKYQRPFNSVVDEEYKIEVNMLRPGTKIPHPSTIGRDVRVLYQDWSELVKDYFMVRNFLFFYINLISSFRNVIQLSTLFWMVGLLRSQHHILGS